MVATTINTNSQYLLPPSGVTSGSVNGRTYTYFGSPVLVPWFDVLGLLANGWTSTSAPVASTNFITVPIAGIGDSLLGHESQYAVWSCTMASGTFGNQSLINNSVISVNAPVAGPIIVPWGSLTQTQLTPTTYGTYNSTTGVITLTFSVQLPGMSVGTAMHLSGMTTVNYNGPGVCVYVPAAAPWTYGFNIGAGDAVVTQTAGYLDGSGMHGNGDNDMYQSVEGITGWACAFTNQNVKYNSGSQINNLSSNPNVANCIPCSVVGFSGGTTDIILQYGLPKILAMNPLPSACIVMAGTNNLAQIDGSQTFSYITNNLLSIYQQLIAAGIRVIACPIPPRSDLSTYNPTGSLQIYATSITWSAGVATVTCSSAHGLNTSHTYNAAIINAKASTGVNLPGLNGQFVITPTNTTTFTYPLATYAAGTAATYAGFTIVSDVATPTTITGLTYTQLQNAAATRRQVNDWILNLDQLTSGLYCADTNAALEDSNSILMEIIHNATDGVNTNLAPLFRQDYLHTAAGGSMYMGYKIAQILNTIFPQQCDFLVKNNTQYSNSGVLAGVGSVYDNLLSNSLFTNSASGTPVGTDITWVAGTAGTGFISGNIPTGWTISGSSVGSTASIQCTYGLANSTINTKYQSGRSTTGAQMVQFVVDKIGSTSSTYVKPANTSLSAPNTTSAPFIRLINNINIANAGLTVGQSVEAYVYIELSTINPINGLVLNNGNYFQGLQPPYVQIAAAGLSTGVFNTSCFPGLNPVPTLPNGQNTIGYVLYVPPYMLNPADIAGNNINFRIYIYFDSAGASASPTAPCQGVVRIGAPTLKLAQVGYVI